MRLANLRRPADYRHPRYLVEPVAAALMSVFVTPRSLMDGARSAGDPIAVLPVLFHLLWCREPVTDLGQRVGAISAVTAVRQ